MSAKKILLDLSNEINTNNIEAVRNILSKNPDILLKFNVSDLPKGTESPLWEAMILGHKEIVQLLINFGANVNERFLSEKNIIYGFTFLQRLAFLDNNWKGSKKVAETLIQNDVNVNASCHHFAPLSPLQIAIKHGNISYAEFLLKNGARLVGGIEWNVTAPINYVLQAPKDNQAEILKLLIKFGLQTRCRGQQLGRDLLQHTILTAVHLPRHSPNKVDVVEIAKIFLNCGISPNAFDNNGESTLVFAVSLGNPELVSLLIEKGADVNLKTNSDVGFFSLQTAACKNDVKILELLLSNSAKINAQDNGGWTALHSACMKRSKQALVFLLRKGALMTLENNDGQTPFALLEPQLYKESDVACINIMVKEIAKLKFSNDSAVLKKDLDSIESHQVVRESFQNCIGELDKMSSMKFYAFYTYYCVLKMSKRNFNKLANLTKNEEFRSKYEENLSIFPYYENDLRRILQEAVQVRDKTLIVESKLKIAFGDYFPDIVLRKLADNLDPDDLQVQL